MEDRIHIHRMLDQARAICSSKKLTHRTLLFEPKRKIQESFSQYSKAGKALSHLQISGDVLPGAGLMTCFSLMQI